MWPCRLPTTGGPFGDPCPPPPLPTAQPTSDGGHLRAPDISAKVPRATRATVRTSQLDRNMDRPPRLDVTCRWVPGRKNCADRSLPIQAACQAGLATAGGKIRGHSHLHSQAIRGDRLHQLLSFVEALLPAKLLPVRLPPLAQDVALGMYISTGGSGGISAGTSVAGGRWPSGKKLR
eukprot:CAMPEP_0177407934 /NCGR_PEP_ID=MMETSP0368-20130122/63396_1 /TAXON_ID=447022 ORGANISM="Scrippsiella hangoei-like, Strain SHHI-4" /NCGR_SAMPLE_ID=MMETSP0368 /ASSEMBLY_ACC=CAM_ASM_000363 /LENGTH=176 /DNA_ID=CAMNT_0018876511 /DNA_START=206 /DNA_END=737 /DNA_ORIENTATION=-